MELRELRVQIEHYGPKQGLVPESEMSMQAEWIKPMLKVRGIEKVHVLVSQRRTLIDVVPVE